MKQLILICVLIVIGVSSVAAQQIVHVPNCNGNATHDTSAFNAIKTAVGGSNPATIRLPWKANVAQRCTVNTITLTSNLALDNTDGSGMAVAAGQTLTVLGARISPAGKTMFFGTGTVVATGGTDLTNLAPIPASLIDVSMQSWTADIVFSSNSATQVNWTSGTISMSGGTTYAISSGNTGAMAALTYIYLDIAVSVTVLQKTTTYSTATGLGKVLVATAQNDTVAAAVIPYSGQQPLISGGQINALSILAGDIAAGAITASKISVSSLSAINANIGTATINATLSLPGASGAIAIGATPPSSASAGTGLWLDRTGLYGLNANTEKFKLDATTGLLTATGATLSGAITATSGAINGPMTMGGATSSIAIGTTPPTSASAGTGIWLDRTGMYGLSTNVLQAKFDAVTGTIVAGAGGVTLSSAGVKLLAETTLKVANSVNFVDPSSPSTILSSLATSKGSGATYTLLKGSTPDATGYSQVQITSEGSSTGGLQVTTYGPSHATYPNKRFVKFGDLSGGLVITPFSNTIEASHELEVIANDISSTSNLYDVAVLRRSNNQFTPATGFGGGLLFSLDSTTTLHQDAARIGTIWTTATHAARTSAVVIQTVNGGAALAEVARFTPTGLSTTGNVAATGSMLSSSPSAGAGYTTGSGGTVVQATDKSTGVTLNKVTGSITMNNAALAAGADVAFTLTNSTIAAADVVVVSVKSGATAASYVVAVGATAAGSCSITLSNISAGSLSEAVVLSFVVIKGSVN